MRRTKTALIVLALVLSGCRKQPDFDQRYTAARQKLEASAAAIDNEIVASASDAAAATTAGPEQPGHLIQLRGAEFTHRVRP